MLKLFGRPASKYAKSNEEIQSLLEMLEDSEPRIDGKENCNSITENLDKSSLDKIENDGSHLELDEDNSEKTKGEEKIQKNLNCDRLKSQEEAENVPKVPKHVLESLDIKGKKTSIANCDVRNSFKK